MAKVSFLQVGDTGGLSTEIKRRVTCYRKKHHYPEKYVCKILVFFVLSSVCIACYNVRMQNDALAFLRLLQLADSALPVGAAAHSFGLETMVEAGWLTVEGLETFLRAYLAEAGGLECSFCLSAYLLANQLETREPGDWLAQWLTLNARLNAFKTARESRQAGAALGRRFLHLALTLEIHPQLPALVQETKRAGIEIQHSLAFGLVGGLLGASATQTGSAYLQQMLAGLVSACQRLLPLGQSQASQVLWRLHPAVLATVERSEAAARDNAIFCFTALVDLGSMRHPALTTRLFIS
jgi:urease accessory protein